MPEKAPASANHPHKDTSGCWENDRRSFLRLSAGVVAGCACALSSVSALQAADKDKPTPKEIDLSDIKEGETKTVLWQGKPLFIRHRTQAEIIEARKVPVAQLLDPQKDEDRVAQSVFDGKVYPQWLVTLGACPHLGCVPRAQKADGKPDAQSGWFCSCHGSHFDASGRVRTGPATKNLPVPPYRFVSASRIVIG